MDKSYLEILICPNCKSNLIKSEFEITCKSCNKRYKYHNDYVDFLPDEKTYWGEVPYQKMLTILEDAKKDGYIQSKLRFSREFPQYRSYLLSSRRIDFIFHGINFNQVNRYLDIGSGFGTLPLLATRLFNEVYSLESGFERIKFQAELRKQEKLKTLYIIRSNAVDVPFKANSFDFITVNGVLEWIGLSDQKKNTKKLQIKFLKDLRRILKQNGTLYIGIENRHAPAYFFGKLDHSGYKYINLFPRFLAHLIVKLYKKPAQYFISKKNKKSSLKKYSTYTYSFIGYRELLKKAGFNCIDVYRTNTYNDPRLGINIKGNSFKFFFRERYDNLQKSTKRIIFSILNRFPNFIPRFLFGYFSPCYLIFAYKSENTKENTFESEILKHFNLKNYYRRSGVENLKGKITYFLGDNEIRKIIKFSRFKVGENNLIKEEKILEQFNKGTKIKKLKVDNRIIFIEPFFKGTKCRIENIREQEKAIIWLLSFQSKTERERWLREKFNNEFEKLRKYIKDLLKEGEIDEKSEKKLQHDLKLFYDLMDISNLKTCSEHGDFCISNILINKDKIHIIDFEYYQETGNPIFDFCFFLLINFQRGFKKILTNNHKYSPIAIKLIKIFANEKKIERELLYYGISYTLIRVMYRADPIKNSWYHNYSDFLRMLKIWIKLNSKSLIF